MLLILFFFTLNLISILTHTYTHKSFLYPVSQKIPRKKLPLRITSQFCANIQRIQVAQSYATESSSRPRHLEIHHRTIQRRSISRIPITQMPIRSLPSCNLDSHVHLSSLSSGEQWRHYGYGPRHRPHGFLSTPAGVTAIFTKAAHTMASCSTRLLIRHLRHMPPIDREAMFCLHHR